MPLKTKQKIKGTRLNNLEKIFSDIGTSQFDFSPDLNYNNEKSQKHHRLFDTKQPFQIG